MLNFVICDDEIGILDKLCNLFEKTFVKNDFDAKIVFKTTDYKQVADFVKENEVNVVVLDIEFKNTKTTGLDVANKIREFNKNCYLIFITSHFEYIANAYNFKTFAYIIKNAVNVDYLTDLLNRLFDDISNTTTNSFLKIDNRGTFVNLHEVLFIEKNGMRLIYHTYSKDYVTYNSFTSIEDKLPDNFVRCHKSFIVNMNEISDISFSTNTINFKDNSVCYIGPKYKNNLMEMIDYDASFK